VRDRLDGPATEDPWADFAQTRHGLGQAGKRLAQLAPKTT